MAEAGSRLLAPASERSTQLLAWCAVPGLRATSLGEVEVKGKREPVDAYLIDAQFG